MMYIDAMHVAYFTAAHVIYCSRRNPPIYVSPAIIYQSWLFTQLSIYLVTILLCCFFQSPTILFWIGLLVPFVLIWYGGVWQIGVFPYSAYHTELSSHSRRRGSDSFSPWAVITHIGRSSKPKPTSPQASNTTDIVSLIPKTSWILHEHFHFITREEEKMMNETVISKTNCRNG